jgi:hypothetical protein
MLLFENELGWRLHEHKRGYEIRRAHPPMRSRIWQFGPVVVNILLVICLWFGADRVIRFTLYAVPGLLLFLWLAGSYRMKYFAWYAVLPALLIFLGLLAGNDVTMGCALGAVPFSLMIGLLGFRPAVLYINVRSRLVVGSGCFPQRPFSQFKVEIDHALNTGRYGVYLHDTEPLWKDSGTWRPLAWESSTEAEAAKVADEFRTWGIGASDAEEQGRLIKADKIACRLIVAAYIAGTVLVILLLMYILPRGRDQLEQTDPVILLRAIQIILGFIFLSIIPFGVYLFRLGTRAVKHRQMPPPGTRVIVDTKVLEGDKAVTRGRLIMIMALLLVAMGLIGGLYLPYKIKKAFGERIINPALPQVEQAE